MLLVTVHRNYRAAVKCYVDGYHAIAHRADDATKEAAEVASPKRADLIERLLKTVWSWGRTNPTKPFGRSRGADKSLGDQVEA